jgi:hypothetical protein
MKKLTISMILTLALLLMTTGPAFAQDTTTTPLTGIVQFITLETDTTTGETTVLVTFKDDTGTTQTVRVSLDTATSLGLVTTDATTGESSAKDGALGTTVTFDPTTVLNDTTEEEDLHPVGSALSGFFSDLLGVDYDTIMTNHEDGTGFGVIAQALWMTRALDGDTTTFQALLDAKKSGDYSAITLKDGSTPTNWGQFRKAVFDDKENAKNNLGSVMSGHAENNSTEEDQTTITANGDASQDDKGKGNDSDNNGKANKDKGKDKGKGKNK